MLAGDRAAPVCPAAAQAIAISATQSRGEFSGAGRPSATGIVGGVVIPSQSEAVAAHSLVVLAADFVQIRGGQRLFRMPSCAAEIR
jgi:hypothetical protein